ncbi:class I SAM-dependent methyltransferase [Pseudomonadota bacterium]
MSFPTIAVSLEEDKVRASQLAQRLQMPLAEVDSLSKFDMTLAYTSQGLVLRDNRNPRLQPVGAGTNKPSYAVRRSDPLGKAMGKGVKTVVDATAGLGVDTLLLWRMGFVVTAVERSPVVAALLQDMIDRIQVGLSLAKQIQVVQQDSISYLSQLAVKPDVIYLDPMFPAKTRASVLAKKELRILRSLVGENSDADQLFHTALACARSRVVVKRPLKALPLVMPATTTQAGKLIRYDVYSCKALAHLIGSGK